MKQSKSALAGQSSTKSCKSEPANKTEIAVKKKKKDGSSLNGASAPTHCDFKE